MRPDVTSKFLLDLERHVLAHRYLYYVMGKPVISDARYDQLERRALLLLPPASRVHQVGSSLDSDYAPDVIQHALRLRRIHSTEP